MLVENQLGTTKFNNFNPTIVSNSNTTIIYITMIAIMHGIEIEEYEGEEKNLEEDGPGSWVLRGVYEDRLLERRSEVLTISMTGPPEEAEADEERGVRKLLTVSLYFLNSTVRFLVAIELKSGL